MVLPAGITKGTGLYEALGELGINTSPMRCGMLRILSALERAMGIERALSVFDAIKERRAIRAYTDESVDEVTIRTLLKSAVQAPTAMHLEPWSFVIIQDKTVLKRYSDRAKEAMLSGTQSHHALVKSPGGEDAHLQMLANPDFNIFYNAGTLIVICGKSASPYVVADCWLAAENLMLTACGMGLGTCCIGFAIPLLNTDAVKADLQIPTDVVAVAPIIVGFPTASVPSVSRKDPLILHWKRQ